VDHKLLSIYLNDHLLGSTVGRDLSRRAAASNRGNDYGRFLSTVAAEIAEDRETLLEMMRALDVRVDPLKVAVGWASEKAGRLKLNGQLTGYSPLSRVVEFEGLLLGVRGKLALWTALERVAPSAPALATFDLPALTERARRQHDELDEHRLRATEEALAR
jgi:hypothetical protein